jgi:antitoxin YefM
MNVLTASETLANLDDVMGYVVDDKSPVLITRKNGEAVVMVSLSDWTAIEETTHLLSNPANARHLRDSIQQLDAGKDTEQTLIEP